MSRYSRFTCILFVGMLMMPLYANAESYWTIRVGPFTQPATCEWGNPAIGIRSWGSRNGLLNLLCSDKGLPVSRRFWNGAISEEKPNNETFCGTGGIITGISCAGSYCDNISVECTTVTGKMARNCAWSPRFSGREDRTEAYYFGEERESTTAIYATGVKCFGGYCSEMQFFICELGPLIYKVDPVPR